MIRSLLVSTSHCVRGVGPRPLSTFAQLPKRVRIVEVGPRDGLQVSGWWTPLLWAQQRRVPQ